MRINIFYRIFKNSKAAQLISIFAFPKDKLKAVMILEPVKPYHKAKLIFYCLNF